MRIRLPIASASLAFLLFTSLVPTILDRSVSITVLTALDDCDTSSTGTYIIDLPTSTATAASATLTAKVVLVNGTSAATPTGGVVVVTAQWVKV